jgi:hypothetical protein
MLEQVSVYVTAGISVCYSNCLYMLQQVSIYATASACICYSRCLYMLQQVSIYVTVGVSIRYSGWNSNLAALHIAFCCTGHFWNYINLN